MFYDRAFTINGTDIVAAQNIYEAKAFWQKKNLMVMTDPTIRECDLDKDGLMVEVQSEMEAVEILILMPLGKETIFKKTKDGMLITWVSLREALKCRDEEEPFFIAKVGN